MGGRSYLGFVISLWFLFRFSTRKVVMKIVMKDTKRVVPDKDSMKLIIFSLFVYSKKKKNFTDGWVFSQCKKVRDRCGQ